MTLDLAVLVGGVIAALVGAAVLAGIGTRQRVAVLEVEVKELKHEVKDGQAKNTAALEKVGMALNALQIMAAQAQAADVAHEQRQTRLEAKQDAMSADVHHIARSMDSLARPRERRTNP